MLACLPACPQIRAYPRSYAHLATDDLIAARVFSRSADLACTFNRALRQQAGFEPVGAGGATAAHARDGHPPQEYAALYHHLRHAVLQIDGTSHHGETLFRRGVSSRSAAATAHHRSKVNGSAVVVAEDEEERRAHVQESGYEIGALVTWAEFCTAHTVEPPIAEHHTQNESESEGEGAAGEKGGGDVLFVLRDLPKNFGAQLTAGGMADDGVGRGGISIFSPSSTSTSDAGAFTYNP